jgi:hypothetical protein
MGVFSCTPTVGYYQVLLRGQLDGQAFNILVYTPNSGTLDYANPASGLIIDAQLGTGGDTPTTSWYETAGNRGVTGTVVINSDGTGSVSGVSVPPSASVPGGANAPLTISGSWKCLPLKLS